MDDEVALRQRQHGPVGVVRGFLRDEPFPDRGPEHALHITLDRDVEGGSDEAGE
jgi:hypothetical protein